MAHSMALLADAGHNLGDVLGLVLAGGIAAVINGASALAFARGAKDDLNVRAAFLHLAADAGISVAVVAAGLVVLRTAPNECRLAPEETL